MFKWVCLDGRVKIKCHQVVLNVVSVFVISL